MGTPASRAVSRIRATKNKSLTIARTGAEVPPPLPPPRSSRGSGGLLTDAAPVLVPLGAVGEGGVIAHAVEVHHPAQVIGPVLGGPRDEVLRDEAHHLPLPT